MNMTMGNIVFLSGVGLLIFTIILGIIFWIKKPQYIPEDTAYNSTTDKHTRKLRNGYPTNRLTIRREPSAPSQFAQKPPVSGVEEASTELLTDETEPLETTEKLEAPSGCPNQTLPLDNKTAPLTAPDETVLLASGTAVLEAETEALGKKGSMAPQGNGGTVPLIPD